ncbi:MAG: Zn-ribbon domain-containing OB-fold protein [Oligoflexia bacterium]|nr:Zn-ribbon domain-containing OB-fold protein [Oligoflexia bacterium]
MFPAKNWREYNHRYRFEASKCKKCNHIEFPSRIICPKCKGRDFEVVDLPQEGKIVTYTIQYVPPVGFEDLSPYVVAIVELTNGVRVTTQIADCTVDEIKNVSRVVMEIRKIREDGESGIIAYGYKFVPQNK